jgi:hypothetical protein
MFKLIGVALVAALAGLGVSMPEARAQGKCWDGTVVRDLKDCSKQPGTKFQSLGGGGKSAMPQGKLSAGEKKSKSGHTYIKIQDIAGETGGSSRGKGAPPPPPPKGDCMSCAD